MIIVGIDPGKSGGICVLGGPRGDVVSLVPMPDAVTGFYKHLSEWVGEAQKVNQTLTVVIEKAQVFPGQGGVGNFNYGRGFGELIGICVGLQVSMQLVPPTTWTKAMHIGCTGDTPKAKSLQAATQLYPSVNFLATPRCKKPHDGMVDAILIATWGKRHLGMKDYSSQKKA